MSTNISLGDPVIEGKGKITGHRVLEVDPLPKIESSYTANYTINGNITVSEVGTYWSIMKLDGTMYGEGHGVFSTSGGETGTWTGQGAGERTADGKIRFRGSLFFNAQTNGALSVLNNMVGIFHFEIDKDGSTTSSKVWEWK